MRAFDRDDLLDLYALRALLEPAAAARAATRIDDDDIARLQDAVRPRRRASVDDQIAFNEDFHRIIVEAAESPRLTVAMRAASGIPRTFRSRFWARRSSARSRCSATGAW